MPDFAERKRFEDELASALLLFWQRHALADPLFRGVEAGRLFTADVVRRPLANVFRASALALADEAELSIERDGRVAAMADQWATQYSQTLAGQLNITTMARVVTAAKDYAGAVALPAAVVAHAFNLARAEVIAATEVTRAAIQGERALVGLYAIKALATWHTAHDERVCEICGPLDGTGVEVYGRVSVSGPPAHPNCRCWLDWSFA